MTNIFDKEDNRHLLDRLEKLTPESKALWGKMNVAQMLLHCQKPIDVALGKLMIKGGLLGFLFGKMAKNSFLKNKAFSKNSPTAPQFKINGLPEFEVEKRELMFVVKAFGEQGPSIIANKKHPFFGEMTDEEWGMLQYLHLDHHLKQFGL
jgi:hypothetical protein